MKIKSHLTTVFFLFFFNTYVPAQDGIRKVIIGEKVPDVVFSTVLEYPFTQIKLSDLKGKLVILDFWSVHCKPCIELFPKIRELQKRYEDQIIILPVSFNNPLNEVKDFIAKRKGTKFEMKLPTIVQIPYVDTVLKTMFPFAGVPHEIWIDKDGILRAITDHLFVTEENIQKVLSGEKIDWPEKDVNLSFYDGEKSLFDDSIEMTTDKFHFRTSISAFQDGKVNRHTPFYKDSTSLRITAVNYRIIDLVKISLPSKVTAVGKYLVVNIQFSSDTQLKLLRLSVNDSSRYLLTEKYQSGTGRIEWKKNNLFCYELNLPPDFSVSEAQAIMRDDLKRLFRINFQIEKLEVPYLALVRISQNNKLVSSGDVKVYEVTDDYSSIRLRDQNIKLLIGFLSGKNTPLILDETAINNPIDIDLKRGVSFDYNLVRNELNRYGLDLISKSKKMDVLVINEKL
ncbi:Thiol-disulfide isomerase or thioredoxin [bacterium A37T11]|nr:Thiol-disulfide isomerase or thioredoxin [bacterium A37T11]